MVDIKVAVEKLHGFKTADELADYFRQYGIKANPQEARHCAITVFVQNETGLTDNVMTTTREVILQELVDDDGYIERKDVLNIQHTHAMAQFIHNFDKGVYPELVTDGYEYDNEMDYSFGSCFCMECEAKNLHDE